MKKIENQWEYHLDHLIPYMSWGGLASSERTRWSTPRHCNTCYELHIVLTGSCCLDFDIETYTMIPSSAVLIAPGIYHAPHDTSEQFCRFSLAFSADSKLSAVLGVVDRDRYIFFEPSDRVISLCKDTIRSLDEDSFFSKELVSSLLSTLMILCLQTVHSKFNTYDVSKKALTQEDEIERIDRFFAKSIHDHPTRKKLAQYLHCSERQLNRKMKTLYGITFQQKLTESRIDLARYLLRTTENSVSDIGSTVGYLDSSSFFQSFRKHVGMTPAVYRKKHQK